MIESVERALRILECFDHSTPRMQLNEIVRRSGYSKSTAYRVLITLEELGWLERTPDGYCLSIKAFQVGSVALSGIDIREQALPLMRSLSQRLEVSTFLLVASGPRATCIERVDGGAVRVMHLALGDTLPLNVGGGPKALLAYREDELLPILLREGLPQQTPHAITDVTQLKKELIVARERGYTLSTEDVTIGVGAIGAPVFDRLGTAVAALSVGGLLSSFRGSLQQDAAAALVGAASELSNRLGYQPGLLV